jgi:hydrogenase maturation factor HypE
MPIRVCVGGAVVACIVLRVEEDIVVGSRVVASVAVVVVIITRRLPRVCLLPGLFSLAERVFAGFAL